MNLNENFGIYLIAISVIVYLCVEVKRVKHVIDVPEGKILEITLEAWIGPFQIYRNVTYKKIISKE